MNSITINSESLLDVFPGKYLFSPKIIKERGDSKPLIVFDVFKFDKWSKIQDGTANENPTLETIAENYKHDLNIAKVQYIGEATPKQAIDTYELEELQRETDKKEADWESLKDRSEGATTYCWKSLAHGFFCTPETGLQALESTIQEMLDAIDDSLNFFSTTERSYNE